MIAAMRSTFLLISWKTSVIAKSLVFDAPHYSWGHFLILCCYAQFNLIALPPIKKLWYRSQIYILLGTTAKHWFCFLRSTQLIRSETTWYALTLNILMILRLNFRLLLHLHRRIFPNKNAVVLVEVSQTDSLTARTIGRTIFVWYEQLYFYFLIQL